MDVDDIGEESINYDEERDPTPTPQLFIPLGDGEDEIDEDFVPQDIETAFNFTPDQLGNIRNCIQYVLLPASSDHPPRNLGEASHGKLKAHELLILFTVILPLVIPELWWRGNETEIRRLQSFCDLVVATNVICAYSTSNVEADIYMDHFVKYCVSTQELYPGFSSMPNHHYAMHGGDQLKFWGPLALLSDMELTMVQKSACKGRLEELLHDNQFTNPATQKLAKILEPREYKSAYTNSRYPSGTLILPTRAKCHSQIPFNNTTFSCTKSHEGQSHIQFYIPGGFGGTWETGYIEAIWELPLEGIKQCFLLVRKHQALSPAQNLKSPY
ncbi:MAG: hypothetical protein NXY57DRAFT_1081683, partial [Lentinula lateritia]